MYYLSKESTMEKKRTTPEFITELQPNEIFVFGSNLKGMHGGGAAYVAYRKFGAIMGQGIRQQAKALQEEGKRILETAKQEVERMIMCTE